VKCCESLSNRISNIIRRHMRSNEVCCLYGFLVYHTLSYFWLHFLSFFYIWLYVLCASVQLCKLCIFIVMFMYSYCYVCNILCILFHCVVLCIVHV
jgi:presenilin-like A22 family membrane protease